MASALATIRFQEEDDMKIYVVSYSYYDGDKNLSVWSTEDFGVSHNHPEQSYRRL